MLSKLEEVIFKKLDNDLSNCSVVVDKDNCIWILDKDKHYYYFVLDYSNKLTLNRNYFSSLSLIFSLDEVQFNSLMKSYFENHLNKNNVSYPTIREVITNGNQFKLLVQFVIDDLLCKQK
jgi:hypothetical protein